MLASAERVITNTKLQLSRWVTVKGQLVCSAAGNPGEGARDGTALDVTAESRGRLLAEQSQKVGSKTGDVRSGHRSAGDGVLDFWYQRCR